MDPSATQDLLGGASSRVVGASSNNAAAAAVMVTNGANGAGAGSAPSSGADPVQQPPQLPPRRCFVTVGATAGFRDLIAEVSTPGFLATLARLGFGRLDVQCGPDTDFFRDRINNLSEAERQGLTIRWFGLAASLEEYFLACRSERDVRLAGCVISHAGSGTVTEVLGVGAPLIVVANATLMDNHQLELAEVLDESNQAVHGHIGNLAADVEAIVERIYQGQLDDQVWPVEYNGGPVQPIDGDMPLDGPEEPSVEDAATLQQD